MLIPGDLSLPCAPQRRRLGRKRRQDLPPPPLFSPPVILVLVQLKRASGPDSGEIRTIPRRIPPTIIFRVLDVVVVWRASPNVDIVGPLVPVSADVPVPRRRVGVPPVSRRAEPFGNRRAVVDEPDLADAGADEPRFVCVLFLRSPSPLA